MVVRLDRQTGTCAHCGRRDVGTPDAGYSGINGERLCHPNVNGRPDCYRLVTVYNHPLDCRCEDRVPIAGSRDAAIWAGPRQVVVRV